MKLIEKMGRICVLMAMLCLTAGTLTGCAEKEDAAPTAAGSTEGGGVDAP